jgi:hypothetical protein
VTDLPAYPDALHRGNHRHIIGIFLVLIPDNIKAIIDKADAIDPRFTTRSSNTRIGAGSRSIRRGGHAKEKIQAGSGAAYTNS